MTGPVLPAAAVLTVALLALGAVPRRREAALAMLGICAILGLLAAGYLIGGAPPAGLTLPIGLPGTGMALALDGLSGFFLLIVAVTGCAAAAASLDHDPGATSPALPVFVGGMSLTLLGGDAFSLLAGFEAMSVASFVLVLANDESPQTRSAALLYLGVAVLGGACLVPAFALLAPSGPLGIAPPFAAIRAHPPAAVPAALVFALVLVGAGAKAGLAPLHVWLPPAHAAAPAHVSALMSGAMTKVALYVLIRVLFDLCGPSAPLWWCVPLLLMGTAGAVIGGLRATVEPDIKTALACSTVENIGLIAIGLGVALAARSADLTALAGLALAGALLHTAAHGTFKSLLFLCAGSIQYGAGTRVLARLGGLIHRMPVTTACMLIGGASLAALPPTSGFAGEWTLFQAVLGAPRVGEFGFQILVCVAAALMALAAALAATAAVRLIGVACLGRPRSPRAAAAEEAGPWLRGAMIGLAGATTLVGLFPGGLLGLAAPAIRGLLPVGIDDRIGFLAVTPHSGSAGYAAPAIAVLLGLAGAAIVFALRGRAASGHVTGPAWDCGFGAPPAWMPFGDPATQYGGASFSQPLRRALGTALLAATERVDMPEPGDTRPARLDATTRDPAQAGLFAPIGAWREKVSRAVDPIQYLTVRRTLSIMFAALVLFLAVVALLEQT